MIAWTRYLAAALPYSDRVAMLRALRLFAARLRIAVSWL